ncbi:MAG TPA: hypothetical protein VFO19_07195, partial [Vicinamibacterales bacterium]|nr:hypothetical protein [Vicinamibacterales bacterium]
RFLLFQGPSPKTFTDVWLLPTDGDRTPVPIVQTEFFEGSARFSPDGRWIVYQSNVSSRSEIYVRGFDPASPGAPSGGVIQVSADGGVNPKWRRDGKELFFTALDGALMAVDVATTPTFRAGTVRTLFRKPPTVPWDPAADGQRFLLAVPTAERGQMSLTVVLDWGTERK